MSLVGPPPPLKGRRVTLRLPQPADVMARLRIGNDPEIHRLYGGSRHTFQPFTEADAQAWVERLRNHGLAWVIEAGTLLGELRFDRVDPQDKRANLAVGIEDANSLGKGFGTEAIRLALTYAFGSMKLHRVSVRVVSYNTRAIRAYEKCSFRHEGREREAALVDGIWHDDLIMGVLDHEYLSCAGADTLNDAEQYRK
jgi:RimJ/RimL family protein N-acetyltransferase